MKTLKPLTSLAWLLACLLGSGCASMNKTTKLPSGGARSLQVVPVAGQPVSIETTHLGTFILAGFVGTAIEHAATSKGRTAIIERLNRDAKDFRPEVILAEEAVGLLRDAPAVWAKGAMLHPESVVVPGGAKLLATETAPFKGSEHYNKWLGVLRRWRKGPPVVSVGEPSTAKAGTLALEVGFSWIVLKSGDKVETAALFRLMDSRSGNVVGARFVGNSYDVRPVTLESDPAVFVEDFRKLARELAKDALTKLRVL